MLAAGQEVPWAKLLHFLQGDFCLFWLAVQISVSTTVAADSCTAFGSAECVLMTGSLVLTVSAWPLLWHCCDTAAVWQRGCTGGLGKISRAVCVILCIHKIKHRLLSLPVRSVGNIWLLRKAAHSKVVCFSECVYDIKEGFKIQSTVKPHSECMRKS